MKILLVVLSLVLFQACTEDKKITTTQVVPPPAETNPANMQMPPGHGAGAAPVTITVEPGSIKKATDGLTVEECFTKQASLVGKEVKVRGKVVKVNSNILGRNWVHIRDGSGKEGTNDLTLTTAANVNPGDVILATGKITTNKDFGAGYFYKVIVEDAQIKTE